MSEMSKYGNMSNYMIGSEPFLGETKLPKDYIPSRKGPISMHMEKPIYKPTVEQTNIKLDLEKEAQPGFDYICMLF